MSINNLNTYLNVRDAHLRVVSGNVYAQAMNIGGINVETAHGLQSVSNTGNATSLTLEFANVTTGFVTTANAQIGRDLVVTGNATVSTDLTVSANATVTDTLTVSEHLLASKEATVTGNLHVTTIMSDSNVVAEYTGPHDRPLRKYPEVALTQNDESATSGYVASASSTATYDTNLQPENAFNGVISPSSGTASWQSSDSGYSGTTPFNYLNSGTHTVSLTDTDGTVHYGDWLSLQTPNRIKVSYYKIHTLNDVDNYRPDSFVLLGSNSETDGTWKLLHTETSGMTDPGPEVYTGHVNSTEFYTYHRLLVKSLAGNGGEVYINELEYYGYEEGSGSLDTTLKSVYNVPATTGTQLEVYYDAKDLTTMPATVTDLSPNSNGGSVTGVTLDTTDGIESFKFATSSSQYIEKVFSGYTQSTEYSASVWFKSDSYTADSYIFQLGLGDHGNGSGVGMNIESEGPLRAYIYGYGSSSQVSTSVDSIATGTWYHATATYYSSGKIELYINGVLVGEGKATQIGTINASAPLTLGTYYQISQRNTPSFNGSIANFRLYSKALNADQVKELYDYQKDYFLGSKSQVTLYKGHLGVGVTEPSGQLELAGDERLQEYPPRALTGFSTYIEGHGVFNVKFANYYSGNTPWGMYKKNNTIGGQDNVWYGPYQNNNGYSGGNVYTGTDYAASTTSGLFLDDVDGIRYYGAWTTIAMPYDIYLKQIHIYQGASSVGSSSSCGPEDGVILGSNNGTDWYHVHTFTGLQYGGSAGSSNYSAAGERVVVNAKRPYNHYALVTTRTHHNDFTVIIGELQWFGTPGPTTLDKGSLTLGRSLDVPRVSRYDVDTETPRPEKLVVDFDTTVNSTPTDISGKGNHGSFVGDASYSVADKAFKFTGASTSDNIIGSMPTSSGDNTFSVSFWLKRTSTSGTQCPFIIGDPSQGQSIAMDIYSAGTVYWFIYSGKIFYMERCYRYMVSSKHLDTCSMCTRGWYRFCKSQ